MSEPAIHDTKSASLAAWNLASQYLDDMGVARQKCLDVLEKIDGRNKALNGLLKKGEFDAKGDGSGVRPFTPTEICAIHKCLTETEKTTIMIATTVIKDANIDTFTEFVRRIKAAGVMVLSEEEQAAAAQLAADVRLKDGAGGARLLPGRVKKPPKDDPIEKAVRRAQKREPA